MKTYTSPSLTEALRGYGIGFVRRDPLSWFSSVKNGLTLQFDLHNAWGGSHFGVAKSGLVGFFLAILGLVWTFILVRM